LSQVREKMRLPLVARLALGSIATPTGIGPAGADFRHPPVRLMLRPSSELYSG
jgi:hypothetical protein